MGIMGRPKWKDAKNCNKNKKEPQPKRICQPCPAPVYPPCPVDSSWVCGNRSSNKSKKEKKDDEKVPEQMRFLVSSQSHAVKYNSSVNPKKLLPDPALGQRLKDILTFDADFFKMILTDI